MKILVLSDLHVEFSPFSPDPESAASADVVVLAGDIHLGDSAASWTRSTFPDKPIVLIAGNHEFYHGHWERTLDRIRESARSHDVHFLENDAIEIEGVRFLGATLWTDFEYFGADLRRASMREAQGFVADYRLIEGCTPQATVDRHVASRAWLQRELEEPGIAAPRVVVTHHYPRKESTPARYRNDLATGAFGSGLPDQLVGSAHLWIHGHTHTSFDYQVAGCRIVCNPRGYPLGKGSTEYENPDFDVGLIINLGN
ncbi:metallophosphoesterase family protein [Acidovorax sp. LjRoot66]|uniref:metallophosphoesterase n=1 Tax=Acidovorax sp. LjRoot66 TaxID=3342334 RepID=UPI003ECE8343